MEIDFSQVLKTFDGEPLAEDGAAAFVTENGERRRRPNVKDMTLRAVVVNAVGGPVPIDPHTMRPIEQLSVEEQVRRSAIAFKIHQAVGRKVSLSSEDVSLLKKVIASRYAWPLLVGQACRLLDPPSEPAGDSSSEP